MLFHKADVYTVYTTCMSRITELSTPSCTAAAAPCSGSFTVCPHKHDIHNSSLGCMDNMADLWNAHYYIKEVWNVQLIGGKNDCWKMASKHYRVFILLLANMPSLRPSLQKQTMLTVYRFTFSKNNLLWLCVRPFLETQFCRSKSVGLKTADRRNWTCSLFALLTRMCGVTTTWWLNTSMQVSRNLGRGAGDNVCEARINVQFLVCT